MKKLLCLVVIALFVSAASAETIEQLANHEDRAVLDYAKILSANETQALEDKLRAFHSNTSNAIVIVTVHNMNGDTAEHFAVTLAQAWGVGDKNKDNGLLILAAMEERDLWITVGYGLEGVIPDSIAKRVYNQQLMPNFKQGAYYKGLDEATDQLIARMSSNSSGLVNEPVEQTGVTGFTTWHLVYAIVLVLILFWLLNRGSSSRHKRDDHFIDGYLLSSVSSHTHYHDDDYGGSGGFGGGSSGGGGFGGGGGGGHF